MKLSRWGLVIAALPGVGLLGMVYSLAIHMRLSLGAWPTSIGERGFPQALITHSSVMWNYSAILVFVSFCVVPAAIVVCLLVRRWRWVAKYFGVFVGVLIVCVGLIMLAPEPFLTWLKD